MGKHKNDFLSKKTDKNPNEKSNEEQMMKNSEDTSIKNKNSNGIKLDLKNIYTFNHEHIIYKENNNKFNIKFPKLKEFNLDIDN